MTGRIDHVAEAEGVLTVIDGLYRSDLSLDEMIATAQLHATLALVEQWRIANLIALSSRGYAHEDALAELGNEAGYALIEYERTPATPTDGPDDVPMTRPEIKEALGLS